ncbi:MAG: glutamine--tRNA ligase/YqeY domain fusion protein [Propionibacteriaceae bacterium]|jgi:glutaminyl-tRNA synthetase|nr:glutamine--tRNA ligase/YqeY domain fusion protein [Propionibacteriaceae bacterium]
MTEPNTVPSDFIADQISADRAAGKYGGRVQTRFPPEPNGYLHIGHAKAIIADFGIAEQFDGICNLRFDDTNPDAEDVEYVESIIDDIAWLGYHPKQVFYASQYFEQLYRWAEELIERGLAYVDDQDAETISTQRGGFGKAGIESPYRDRSPQENLALFRAMRAGQFADGAKVLRAKIDMQSDNMSLRDPVMYRIRRTNHHRTGDQWVIYPNYDWAHGQSDAIEGVTHSMCTLEFVSHRPLYNWFLDQLDLPGDHPQQMEFARLELTHTVTSKRKLRQLVVDGLVDGWDDPRMPTIQGLRRRGYPAAAIRAFCEHIGLTKTNARHRLEELESFVRAELNRTAQRRMAVLKPLKLVLDDWPTTDGRTLGEAIQAGDDYQSQVEWFELTNNPENPGDGSRMVPFSGELWIERDDFALDPPPRFFRLSPGREVRLRGAYLVTATSVDLDDSGQPSVVHASFDPASRGGNAPDGRKVKSTMHWLSAPTAVDIEARLYDRLFSAEAPGAASGDPMDDLNRDSVEVLTAKGEPSLGRPALDASLESPAGSVQVQPGQVVQFERLGYFAADPRQDGLFHRTVGLRDEWAALAKKGSN